MQPGSSRLSVDWAYYEEPQKKISSIFLIKISEEAFLEGFRRKKYKVYKQEQKRADPEMHNMLEYLTPCSHAPLRCGTNVAKNQPDIEACAMCLGKLPSNRAEFEVARGTRDFIIAKFLVLALGPPGFGKVPYNSKRSVGQKEEAGKPLYETTDDGRLRLFSFEKGKTNKDKGARVEADESCGILEPGLVLSFFLREEFWDPSKIIPADEDNDTIGLGTVVAIQISSGNVDAAAKGYLLKLKKMKILSSCLDLAPVLSRLPASEDDYDRRISQYRTDYPAMKGGLDSSTEMRCFATQSMGPDACAFEHEGGFVISNARTHNCEGFRDDIFVPTHVAKRCFQIDNPKLAIAFMNIALAVQSVGAIIKTCASNVMLSAEDVHPLVALTLVLDVNVLLSLDALDVPEIKYFLRSDCDGPFEARDIVLSKDDSAITWKNMKQAYITDTDNAKITFVLHQQTKNGHDGAHRAYGQLSVGCSGPYKTLSLYLTRQDIHSKVIDLELRLADATSTRQKRKRPELMFDGIPSD